MVNVITGAAANFRRRFLDANGNLALGGFSVPLLGAQGYQPARVGFDYNDLRTPFVWDQADQVVSFYPGYRSSLEFKSIGAPYAETRALRLGYAGFPDGKDVEQIDVRLLSARYALPDRLQSHAKVAVDMFQRLPKLVRNAEGEWENNETARVTNWDMDAGVINLQTASYFDQVATNLTLDWASGQFGDAESLTTLRLEETHDGGKLCPLAASMLANTLGVACVVVDPKGEMLVNIRGNKQAIMAGTGGKFHCSASGVFELPPGSAGPASFGFDVFMAGMRKEILSELAMEPEDYELIPLAFSRELVRGGKPQLFFVARARHSLEEIRTGLHQAEEAWEFIAEDDLPGNSPLAPWLEAPFLAPKELFTYEGLMAFAIAGAYLEGIQPPFPL